MFLLESHTAMKRATHNDARPRHMQPTAPPPQVVAQTVAPHPARIPIEKYCAQYLQQKWPEISFIATINAPWYDPKAFASGDIEAYCRRLIAGLLNPLNQDHKKFMLTVQKYKICEEILQKEFHPNGRLALLSEALNESFHVPLHLRYAKFAAMRGMAEGKLASTRSVGLLRVAYGAYLKALDSFGGGCFRPSWFIPPRDSAIVQALLDEVPLTLRKARVTPSLADLSPSSEERADPEEGEVDNDDERHLRSGSDGADDKVMDRGSALPGPVVHRWSYRPLSVPVDDHRALFLGDTIRRTFVLPAQRHSDAANEAFAPNPDVKMMFFHCVWLASQPQAPTIPTPYTTIREQTKLGQLARICEGKTVVDSLQQRVSSTESIFTVIKAIRSVSEAYGLDRVEHEMYLCDVESGRARQAEGAKNEQRVWSAYEDVLVHQVVLPLHNEIIHAPIALASVGKREPFDEHVTATYYRGRPRCAAAVSLGLPFTSNPILWVRKCFAMELTDEEMSMVSSHPLYDADAFEEERLLFAAQDGLARWEARRRYFLFRIFAEFCVELPFYHFVDESALSLASQTLPTTKQLDDDPTIPSRDNGMVYKNVGELDGMLLDLNGDHDVLACFEIKANPADIGKAYKQGLRLCELLDAAADGRVSSTSPSSLPSVPRSAIVMSNTTSRHDEEDRGQSSGAPPLGNPNRQPMNMRVLPASAPKFSAPYYEHVFPLYANNFQRFFGDPVRRMERWYIVTNIPYEADATSLADTHRRGRSAAVVGGHTPPWYVPCAGCTRHFLVDAMAMVLVQSLPGGATNALQGGMPPVLDRSAAMAMARRLSGQMTKKKNSELSPKDVLTLLGSTGRLSNIVWLEKKISKECA